jgi:hypothetical protein
MKKLITTTLIVLAFTAVAFGMPNYEIKIVEVSAAACGSDQCEGG